MDERRANPWAERVVLAGFFLALLAPVGLWVARVPDLAGVPDLRKLAEWPEWSETTLRRWPAEFEAWLNDHYPQRSRIIRWHSVVQHEWLKAPSSNVLVGQDAWLYYAGDYTFEDFVGRHRFTDAQLEQWRNALEGRRAWLRERGIDYLFVIAPNKSTIYPEKLPSLLQAQAKSGKLDQLVAYLREHSTVPVLDLRPTLFETKARTLAYWPADTHWNGHGHLAAYRAIMRKLEELGFARAAPDHLEWLSVKEQPHLFDCVTMLGMKGVWPTSEVPVLQVQRPPDWRKAATPLAELSPWKERHWLQRPQASERESGEGRVLLLCDSFLRGGGLREDRTDELPFMLNFRRFVSVWLWVDQPDLARIVEIEKPDLVIEEWVERFLHTPPNDHPDYERARAAANAGAKR